MKIPNLYKKIFERAKWSRTNAIKAKCLDCTCFQREEITVCSVEFCPLHELRPYQEN